MEHDFRKPLVTDSSGVGGELKLLLFLYSEKSLNSLDCHFYFVYVMCV